VTGENCLHETRVKTEIFDNYHFTVLQERRNQDEVRTEY
jgi:hypothetical protein